MTALAVALVLAAPVPRVEATLPRWVAPGAIVTVRGWTEREAPVTLLAGSRTLGKTAGGRFGRFVVSGPAPAPGRWAIAVATAGRRLRIGTLVVRPVLLAAGGDVTFGDTVGSAIAAYGPGHPWRSVGPLLRSADVATVNLEGAVSSRGRPEPSKEFTFRGQPAALSAAARLAGLDVVSVANNHSLDFGREAFADTLRTARAAGIATAGGGASLRDARRPALIRRGGLRIAFLGYGDIEPPSFFAGPASPGTAPADPRLVVADVGAAARVADLVVVWFHWGIELDTRPTSRQRELAEAALDAGADLVLGAHPHVLQPLERRGRRLIAWSLGNFVFIPHSPGTDRSGVLLVGLDARGVRSWRLRPAIAGAQPRLTG